MDKKDGNMQVLLVDDNNGDTRLLMEMARNSAPDTHFSVAHSGEEAMAFLKRSHEDGWLPELVLLDLKMPGRDGFSVLAEIRSMDHLRYLPVVIFTSSRAEVDVQLAYKLKANAYLVKPVELGDLGLVINSIENFWRNNISPHGPGRGSLPSN